MSRKLFFPIQLLLVLTLAGPASAICCDANCTEPNFFVHGLCFSPYKDGQAPPDYVSPEQIRERLDIITRKKHTNWIRTYSATNGLEEIPAAANSVDLKVAMGTWIRDNMEQEVNNLVAKAQLGLVDMVVVGNEELYAGASTVEELINDVNYVRQRLDDANCNDIPIAIAEPHNTLFHMSALCSCSVTHWRLPDLIAAVDVVMVHIYPFHEGIHIDAALQDLALTYECVAEAVHAIDPDTEVIIGETGWASDGLSKGDAEPSLVNLARYFSRVSEWAASNGVPVFYFEAFDEKWKENPNYLYTLIESHWGIWDSKGILKHTFVPEPVLCETFDGPVGTPFHAENYWASSAPEPNILAGDPNCEGNFLRLLYDDTGETHYSYVAFDRVAVGPYPRIDAQFNFRMHGPDPNEDADGFSFMLLPTSLHGITGPTRYGNHQDIFVEEPSLPQVFAIGFDLWEHPANQACDHVYMSWDGDWYPDGEPCDVSTDIDLDNGSFHRARIQLRADGDDSLLTFVIEPNICQPNAGDPIIIAENLRIPGLKPYENRVEFAGRAGGEDVNIDIDNVKVTYKPELHEWFSSCWDCRECAGQPSGDATCDGSVNLGDLFALKAHFGQCAPWTDPECCADFNQDECVNLGDLFVLKTGFGTSGYSPSTGNQVCPR
jgi:exo-beta-1,3-glucanase (GH17 family)